MTFCRHNKHEKIIMYQLMNWHQQQNPHQRAPAAAAEFPVPAPALSLTVYKLAKISEISASKTVPPSDAATTPASTAETTPL